MEQSYSTAYNLYRDTCDMNNGDGCYNLGRLLQYGLGLDQAQKLAKVY